MPPAALEAASALSFPCATVHGHGHDRLVAVSTTDLCLSHSSPAINVISHQCQCAMTLRAHIGPRAMIREPVPAQRNTFERKGCAQRLGPSSSYRRIGEISLVGLLGAEAEGVARAHTPSTARPLRGGRPADRRHQQRLQPGAWVVDLPHVRNSLI